MKSFKGMKQIAAICQDELERNLLISELKKNGFKCGHTLVDFDDMSGKELDFYFSKLPFIIDFNRNEFFATNITCLSARCMSEKGRASFIDANTIIEWLTLNLPSREWRV